MTNRGKWVNLAAVLCIAITGSYRLSAKSRANPQNSEKPSPARVVTAQELPRMEGGHLKVTLVEVNYGPGEYSHPHSHPCPVIGYVIEGAVRTQVKGQPEAIYKAGESFYEPPNGVHQVSANASDKEAAKFLAYFVCDHEAALSSPVSESPAAGDK